jgi:hypothetical protein
VLLVIAFGVNLAVTVAQHRQVAPR